MNKLLIYGLLALAITSAIGGAYLYVQNLQDSLVDSEKANAELALAVQLKSQEVRDMKERIKVATQQRAIAQAKMAQARESAAKVDKVFGNHDFGGLLSEKTGLVNRRMRVATKRVFDNFETASGGTAE